MSPELVVSPLTGSDNDNVFYFLMVHMKTMCVMHDVVLDLVKSSTLSFGLHEGQLTFLWRVRVEILSALRGILNFAQRWSWMTRKSVSVAWPCSNKNSRRWWWARCDPWAILCPIQHTVRKDPMHTWGDTGLDKVPPTGTNLSHSRSSSWSHLTYSRGSVYLREGWGDWLCLNSQESGPLGGSVG